MRRYQLSRHEGKRFDCSICQKEFTRKSKLKKHICVEISNKNQCVQCNKTFVNIYTLKRHSKQCIKPPTNRDLLQQVLQQNKTYEEQIGLGKKLNNILNKHSNIQEDALNDDQKKALQLYQSTVTYPFNEIILRPWQKTLLPYFNNPTERKVIWITGQNGNEGKTYFQNYIQFLFGVRRVCLLDMVRKSENIFHVLSKQSLTCKDIFLFNLPKNVSVYNCSYDTLEALKDGKCISSKYNSSILKFKLPNIVMVFGNSSPFTSSLSDDRWLICQIENNELIETKNTKSVSDSKLQSKCEQKQSKKKKSKKNYSSDEDDYLHYPSDEDDY